jgi:hypothetical protein
MARRRYRDDDDPLAELISGLAGFFALYMLYLYITDKSAFWRNSIYTILVLIGCIVLLFSFRRIKNNLAERKASQLLAQIKNSGMKDRVNNFINRFGLEKKKANNFCFRNHCFEWERLNDFRKELASAGIKISMKDYKDMTLILREYIQIKEENYTINSVEANKTYLFSSLSGEGFEKLLIRLFEKMEFSTQHIGGSGDQGGDLIAVKGNDRILVQAKCYNNTSLSNKAIQEAAAARTHYDCNRAMVIATSDFTHGAIALSRTTDVQLVAKKELQQKLLNFLGESWN